jgi:predicted transcriptional regulator
MMPTFGEREIEVMHVLWERGSGTAAEVRAALDATVAYNTVLTILRNLQEKGCVRHEPEGRSHRYFPVVQEADAQQGAVGHVIDRLFDGSPERLMAHLVRGKTLSAAELRRLRRLLDGRLREKGS